MEMRFQSLSINSIDGCSLFMELDEKSCARVTEVISKF